LEDLTDVELKIVPVWLWGVFCKLDEYWK